MKFNPPNLKAGKIWLIIMLLCLFLAFYLLGYDKKSHFGNQKEFIDSLQNELFIKQTIIDRYEITIDRIKEEDSLLYEKFENYLSDTE